MAKTRVHELAKEFGVESKFVLEKFKEMGEFVKSASSTVELPAEMRFRKEIGEKLKAEQASAPAAAEKPAAKPAPKPAAKPAAERPGGARRREARREGTRHAGAQARPQARPEGPRAHAGPGRRAAGCRDHRGRARQAGGTRGPGRVGLPGHAQGTGPASGRQARHAAARQQPLRLQPGHGSASCSPPRRGRAGCTRRWRRRPASAASAGRP